MGCENLATKADIEAVIAAVRSSEARILSELDNKFRAVSLQISESTTTLLSKSQEILNEIIKLNGKVEQVNNNILVVIPIVTKIVAIVVSLELEVKLGFQVTNQLIANVKLSIENAISLITQLKSDVNSVRISIEGVRSEVSQVFSVTTQLKNSVNANVSLTTETLNVATETLSTTTSIQTNFPPINARLDVLNTLTQNTSNNLNVLAPALPRGGGGGGIVLDVLIPRINNVLETIERVINIIQEIEGDGGSGCPELLTTEVELTEVECIDCDDLPSGDTPCSESERDSSARESEVIATGIPEALTLIDKKLAKIVKESCRESVEDILFCQVVVTEEPVKNKVYYGSSDRETIVFAGWVKFFRDVLKPDGSSVRFELGNELPVRRLVEFFPLPEGANGYYVQPINNSQLQHSLVRVRGGKVVSGLIV